MEPDRVLTVPLSPAPSVTVEIGAAGPGMPGLHLAGGGTVRLDTVTLSPFSCRAQIWRPDPAEDVSPLLFFLTREGTFLTLGQTAAQQSSYLYREDGTGSCLYRFERILDLSHVLNWDKKIVCTLPPQVQRRGPLDLRGVLYADLSHAGPSARAFVLCPLSFIDADLEAFSIWLEQVAGHDLPKNS